MTITVSRLRMWFAVAGILMVMVVMGAYFYAKWRVENALKEVPEKIGIDIKQSANGLTISKSEGSRTLFKIEASKALEYKKGGIAELHKVNITIYGQDSSRFDQIYGDDFEYDPQSGDVTAKGEVQIDLEANPAGIASPDQSIPEELKNPIHLKTSGLVFNQKTGNGSTTQKVEFQIPQASGSAVGADYTAQTGMLTLHSQVQISSNGDHQSSLMASKAVIEKQHHTITLDHVRAANGGMGADADRAILFLAEDNTVDRVQAAGNVHLNDKDKGKQSTEASSDRLDLQLTSNGRGIRRAVFSDNVRMESSSSGKEDRHMQMSAGLTVLNFTGQDNLVSAHAEKNVTLVEHQRSSKPNSAQDVELTAPAMDFSFANGHLLQHAQTSGPPQITLHEDGTNLKQGSPVQTLVTAGRFDAEFNNQGQIRRLQGEPSVRIVTSSPKQADRISTSDRLNVDFNPGVGASTISEDGNVVYTDDSRKAWADHANYTVAGQILTMTGSPRVTGDAMSVSAETVRFNHATGDVVAEGDVKATYVDLKSQPDGALLASSSPIHVTAQKMTVHKTPSVAFFNGNVRLWQDANVVQAPAMQFDRDRRYVLASGMPSTPVSTVLMQSSQTGKVTPVTIQSSRLEYIDKERQIHFNGGVTAEGSDLKLTANHMDVFLAARAAKQGTKDPNEAPQPGKIEQIVAQGGVLITEADRKAAGGQLVYTTADEKFVLSGNLPSIFSAEHGKITGVSLTFFRHDDRVLVEGSTQFPAVTHTQMAR